jgi:hypothetical protein
MPAADDARDETAAFDAAIAAIPTCALDREGMRAQRDRYARLASDVRSIERKPEALLVTFCEAFDRQTLEAALAVERECCPFFVFDFDESARHLHAAVRERDQLPALDAIANALGPPHDTLR